MDQSERNGGGRVPEEELAEIRRQLRDTLGEPDAAAPQPAMSSRARPRDRGRTGPATMTLRFVGGFVAPGLILVAVLLVETLFS